MNKHWDKKLFRDWLLMQSGTENRKVSTDTISRCARVEKSLGINLIEDTKDIESYNKLIAKINDYACKTASSPSARYAIKGSMVLAVKKFTRYYWNVTY
jgi:hypothetical protein